MQEYFLLNILRIRVWLLPGEADVVSAVSVGLWSVLVVGDVEFEGDDKGISR